MSDVSFREIISSLREDFVRDPYPEKDRHPDFFYIMDSISDNLVIKWAERASKIKTPIHGSWDTQEWMQLNNIISYTKTYDPMTMLPWTKKQKRFCIFMIVKYWDDLEMMYYC